MGTKHTKELSFIPSAVSSSADWPEPKFMCDQQKGFKYHDIVSVMVEDDGEPHAINLSANNRTWTTLVGEKRSRGELAVCLGARGLEQQILDIYADEKIYAQSLLKDATEAVSLTKEWPETSP